MYAKVFESIYDGTLVENWHALVTFQQMLVLCDAEGFIDMTPRALSNRTGIPIEIIDDGIKHLEEPDPNSRTPDMDGCRIERIDEHRAWGWRIVNYLKYREMRDEEKRREQNREAQQRRRDRQHPSAPVSSRQHQSAESAQAEAEAEAVKRSVGETVARKPRAASPRLSDEDFIKALKSNPAYKGIDIARELGKLDAWLLTPKGAGKQKTRQRIVNWLNKCDRAMPPAVGPPRSASCRVCGHAATVTIGRDSYCSQHSSKHYEGGP